MPGFVDVSNMSDLEVKRMGQRDDDVQTNPYAHRNLSRRNPYGYGRNRPSAQPGQRYCMTEAWAAAAAAQRINGGYLKDSVSEWDDITQSARVLKLRNREIMMQFLTGQQTITQQDRDAGQAAREYLKQDITMRALKGKLSDFDTSVSRVLAIEDEFDSQQHRLELAVLACLPNSAQRNQTKGDVEYRMRFAQGGVIGKPGDRVTVDVEILSANFSQNYNIFFVNAVTDKDQPVTFTLRERFDAGTRLTIHGRVKLHSNNQTRLNYVKVL